MENNFPPILLLPICHFLRYSFLIPKYSEISVKCVSISPVVDTWSIIIIYTFGDITIGIWWTELLTRRNWTFFPFEFFLVVHCKTADFTHSTIISLSVMFRNWSAIIFVEMIVCSLYRSLLTQGFNQVNDLRSSLTTDRISARVPSLTERNEGP